ncbi:hypothetical protein [Salinirubellus litoreus]|uniref:hypothetical protein n=1 Tax=unclassified Salinirubellus TaxID=2627207 RepID=UPI00360C6C9D
MEENENDRQVSGRRTAPGALYASADAVAVDFTRDGYRTVFVEVGPDADEEWRLVAERLGYTVEGPGTDVYRRWRVEEWWEGSAEAVHVLRLDPDREPLRL